MKKAEFCHFWAESQPGTSTKQGWYRYQTGVVLVPLMQRQNGTGTIQSGTGTTLQNRFGTGTKHSGTGTTSSCKPGFWYLCIVKL